MAIETFKKQLPLCYIQLYARMQEKAKELGYGLTLHGSLVRDCDMVGIPWTDKAVGTEEFVKAMIETSRGTLGSLGWHEWKPHGRLAWAIHLGAGPYIDLSVMPRIPRDPEPFAEHKAWLSLRDDLINDIKTSVYSEEVADVAEIISDILLSKYRIEPK